MINESSIDIMHIPHCLVRTNQNKCTSIGKHSPNHFEMSSTVSDEPIRIANCHINDWPTDIWKQLNTQQQTFFSNSKNDQNDATLFYSLRIQ